MMVGKEYLGARVMTLKLSDAFVRQIDKELKEYNEYMFKYVNSFAHKRRLVRLRRIQRQEEQNDIT
jgi:hypothetical protein